MYISFTGHRDKFCSESDLEKLLSEYPESVWIHGGAIGFDTQVENYAKKHGIKTIVVRPDYQRYGRRAPLIRNDEIINRGDILVALYDGRIGGGTYYTIQKAKAIQKNIVLFKPQK